MAINNKNLLQHLREYFGNTVPVDLLPFFDVLNEVYNQNERYRHSKESLIKVKNKTRGGIDGDRLKAHNLLVQSMANTGSWEFDFTAANDLNDHSGTATQAYYFSEQVYNILGLKPGDKDINKDFFFPGHHPADLKTLLEREADPGRYTKRYQEEHTITLPDGTEKSILKQSEVFFESDNITPLKVVGTIRDVTAERRLEYELQSVVKEKENALQQMFNAYLSYDVRSKKVTFFNEAFRHLFEDTSLLVQERTSLLSIIPEPDKAGRYYLMRKLVSGIVVTYSFRICLVDGTMRWVEARMIPALGKDGRLQQVEFIAQDVTSYKRSDKKINKEKNEFQKQLFGVGEVVLLVNSRLELTYVSENVCRLLGYMPEEITGMQLLEIVHPADNKKVTAFYKGITSGKKGSNRIACRLMSNAATEVWCECVVQNMSGNPLIGGIITRVRDMTFFKKQEDELISTLDDLKKVNSNLEDFVSVISHDLRAPLSSMKGIISIIDSKEGSAAFSQELDYLGSSIGNLERFILDLLDYSKLTRGELRSELVHLDQLLEQAENHLKFMNPESGKVAFRKNVLNGVLFYSDSRMINIVLSNLISNAIRYSNPSSESPFVEVRINATNTGAQIDVIDNGIGIAKENQEKIFDMFYRVSDDSNGTGMGLHLVKLAIEKLSGTITLESEQNVGTKFSIYIPNMLNRKN